MGIKMKDSEIRELALDIASLQEVASSIREQLKGHYETLRKTMELEEGKNTTYNIGPDCEVKVKYTRKIEWIQENLSQITVQDDSLSELFHQHFHQVWVPIDPKALNKARKLNQNFDEALNWSSRVVIRPANFEAKRILTEDE